MWASQPHKTKSKNENLLMKENLMAFVASRASRWSAPRSRNPTRKETQRRIASLPASGSSFDENMLGGTEQTEETRSLSHDARGGMERETWRVRSGGDL